jgi:hypothetical protein
VLRPPGPRLARAAVVVLPVLLLPVPASAQVEPIRLTYRAYASCPTEGRFVLEVTARTERGRVATPGEAARAFVVTVTRETGTIRGLLSITSLDGAVSEREVTGDTCREVVSALALITALCRARSEGATEPRAFSPRRRRPAWLPDRSRSIRPTSTGTWASRARSALRTPTLAPGYAVTLPNGSGNAEILRCAKGGCNGQPGSLVKGLVAPMALATDGNNVYFTDLGIDRSTNTTNTGRVAKCPVAGCSDSGTTIADKLENPRGIAVDETSIYWADFGSGAIDADSVCLAPNPSCGAPSPLSVDGRIMVSPK